MYFDDRLATVLRTGTGSDRALRTQYRQLLDLLGTLPRYADGSQVDAAYERLAVLSGELPSAQRSAIIREPGMRLANPALVAILAAQEGEIATATMAVARLQDADWQTLIPDLSVAARGFLRHRRDLEPGTNALLERLGVNDLVLPAPDILELSDTLVQPDDGVGTPGAEPTPIAASSVFAVVTPLRPLPPVQTPAGPEADNGDDLAIGALVRRIEAFQRARSNASSQKPAPLMRGSDAPLLPLNDLHDARRGTLPPAFDFTTDAAGRIDWCEPAYAPMAYGLMLASQRTDAPARLDQDAVAAMRHRQPLKAVMVTIEGAPAIAGIWCLDAIPQFDRKTGGYLGYSGRMRRPSANAGPAADSADPMADRVRQILHELRTPVNAIQGFAEIIQQQLYGPAPHEYRALAATIASDAARILAGFDELDRLARLESGALELDEGHCDFATVLASLVEQIRPALVPRASDIAVSGIDGAPAIVALTQADAERLCWRILATIVGEASAGEELAIGFMRDSEHAIAAFEIPANLSGSTDIFSASLNGGQRAVSAGMFGTGFTLRLARAEAQAVGGSLTFDNGILQLVLPLLTGEDELPSHGEAQDRGR
ncbi:hypothetical protein NT2_01_03980 [Caenibius tardaugens NBRC 16725]|uniref:histidine kinase n=1 Tax=Caenibius tardaugens NBRC 16725 TaxID=1219035 RepID=U2YHZ1_9SPHN|nr:histidine kinase dimerization/phospho-acceptor domain-containing protein [Caenibius tardaugens]AZI37133.1 sensor histidine kinase [Caenibius tardaugens NBRC 16725]GAD47627.1 hypothetical protein NT2_01_03980 [Caenibius tardaugens NBRC 16725]